MNKGEKFVLFPRQHVIFDLPYRYILMHRAKLAKARQCTTKIAEQKQNLRLCSSLVLNKGQEKCHNCG